MATYSGTNVGTPGTDAVPDGGAGLSITNGTDNTITAAGSYTGGAGADALFILHAGHGGVGVDLSGSSSLTNHGVIVGGLGGDGIDQSGGNGGVGVLVGTGSTLVNDGTISGGNGQYGLKYNGLGGVGVDMAGGGTLQNAGIISGGQDQYGVQADSVHFGAGDSRLIIDAGAVFQGKVVADAGFNNVIELNAGGAGTINGIGSQYLGFNSVQIDAGSDWTINGTVDSFVSIDLGGANAALSDTLSIGAAGGFAAEISNFDANDTINLDNVAFGDVTGSSFDASTGVLTLSTAGGDITLDFANPAAFAGLYFDYADDLNGGINITLTDTPCYCPGTLILTERGEVAVESLSIGDRVVTVSGGLEPIKWIGRRSYAGRFLAGKQHIQPIRIKAGALMNNLPKRDLILSPLHAMFIDGLLIPAGQLVNGVSILREQVSEVHYLHIELGRHDVIWAEGAASETFIDDDCRGMFQNADEYAGLYPDAVRAPVQYCAPRVTDGYELEAIRQRLAAHAALAQRWAA